MALTRPLAVTLTVAALALISLAASGCGDGMFSMGEMHQRMHRQGDLPAQTPVLSGASEVTVEIRDYDYSPRDLTVSLGTTVTWINSDSVPHDATSGDSWGTALLTENASASISFDEPGSYDYICSVHPYMTGTVTVEETL